MSKTIATFDQIAGPSHWLEGRHWLAQLFEADSEMGYPLAVAWIFDMTLAPELGKDLVIEFLMVPDHLRGKWYAGRLVKACRKRWPEIRLTDRLDTIIAD